MIRRRGDRAAVVVEAAVAIPILILFVLALVDLGTWTLESNKAANAARDGARNGIIGHVAADAASSGDRTAIIEAIQAHLPGRTLVDDDVEIECVDPDGDPVIGGCAAATVDQDRIRVATRWDKELITPVGAMMGVSDVEVRGVATMVIVGRPLAPGPSIPVEDPDEDPDEDPPPPGGCTVTDLTASPSTNTSDKHGRLSSNVGVAFTTSGTDPCSGLTVELEAYGGDVAVHGCGCGGGANRSWSYHKNSDSFWSPGQAEVRIMDGTTTLASTTFTVN